MMATNSAPTRDRLLDAAISLFASRGYAATSVAEIQRACGLSPGSGALYKHFASKQELLEAATRRQLERMAASRQRINSDPGASPIDILRRITEAIWEGIETNADLFRVMFRDPDAIDNFADELWSGVTANTYQKFANTLRAATKSGPLTLPILRLVPRC